MAECEKTKFRSLVGLIESGEIGIDQLHRMFRCDPVFRTSDYYQWSFATEFKVDTNGRRMSSGSKTGGVDWKIGQPLPEDESIVGLTRPFFLGEDRGEVGEFEAVNIDETVSREEYEAAGNQIPEKPSIAVYEFKKLGKNQCQYCGAEGGNEGMSCWACGGS